VYEYGHDRYTVRVARQDCHSAGPEERPKGPSLRRKGKLRPWRCTCSRIRRVRGVVHVCKAQLPESWSERRAAVTNARKSLVPSRQPASRAEGRSAHGGGRAVSNAGEGTRRGRERRELGWREPLASLIMLRGASAALAKRPAPPSTHGLSGESCGRISVCRRPAECSIEAC
jgi:hypothetical protein